ncbi:MAG TPA: CinA family protein [Hyphomicrobiaceae bacterium]|nr:CinA family protein [Hyphomicrobiaceae bacterium]
MTEAASLLEVLRQRTLKIVTAESCTGGLIAGLLTEIPGSSDVVERGFVVYSNDAKMESLGVPGHLFADHGAVSRPVAEAMASGALMNSLADVSIAVTGVAGPGGGTALKPVGLVHIAAATLGGQPLHQECRFGDIGRSAIRLETIKVALALVRRLTIDMPLAPPADA